MLIRVFGIVSLVAGAVAVQAVASDSVIRQNLFSTCFVDTQEAWVIGELGRVFHTSDGGSTFERSKTDRRDALLSVACLSGGTVVVVGPDGLALRTIDKGQSWQKLDTGTERTLLGTAFATPQIGIAVGDYGTIIRTEDGGTTWSPVSLPEQIPLPEDIAEIIEPGDVLLYDVTFATPERGWIVGEFGVIMHTADAGRTWQATQSPVETTLFGVGFSGTQNGWAAGIEGVMLHTADGGETWMQQAVPKRSGFVLALYDVAVDGRVGWAIGDSGYLIRTVDGGDSWHAVDLPIELAANWFRGLALNGSSGGLIVGSEGLRLVTSGEEYRRVGQGS